MSNDIARDDYERMIALFLDFENIVEGAREAKSRFEIKLIIQRILDKGRILTRRAYADFGRFAEYKQELHSSAVELIDIPRRRISGKNSADIRMVVDALDMCYSKTHIDTFALITGDSDFSPLVSKLRENNKYVIGIGAKKSTSELLISNCDEFIYYEDILREKERAPAAKVKGVSEKQEEVYRLLVEAVRALQRENRDTMHSSLVKDTIKRKNPSFDETYYEYSSFTKLLEDAQRNGILTIEKSPKSGTYVVTGLVDAS